MNIAHDTKLNGELIFRRPSVFRILLKSKRGTSVSIVSNTGRDLRIRDENIRNRRMRVRHQNSISIPNHLSLLFPYDLRLPPDDILLLSEDGILDGAEVFELRAMATSWQPEILWIDKRKLCIIRIASSYPGGPGRIYADYSEFVRLKGDSEMYVYNSLIVSHENRPLWSVKLSNVEGHFISEVRKGELDFGPEKSLLESVLEGCIRDGLVPILLVIFVLLIINIVRRRGGRNSSLRGMR